MSSPAAGAPLSQWLRWLEQLHPREIELGLERVREVAQRLDLARPSAVTLTVAGTNGKGTSAGLAASIFQAAGHRVGLYTSPHLLRYNERIRINGDEVSDAPICEAFARIEQARGDVPLTYFEFGTLAALMLFRDARVGVQVLEVGLGGRLDAVNLVDPDASLLTSVGIDHVAWLGPDRERIGWEKAHIFRAGRPAICGDPDVPASVVGHARALGADLWLTGRDFTLEQGTPGISWSGRGRQVDALELPEGASAALVRNLPAVLAAVTSLQDRLPVPEQAMRQALNRFTITGRFQRRGRLLLDVAHNEQAAQLLAQQLRENFRGQRLPMVLGMLEGKDVEAFCGALAQSVGPLYCAGLPPPRGIDTQELLTRVQAIGLDASGHDSVADAIRAAQSRADEKEFVLVTGSFLTVAAGLAHG